MHIMLPWQNVWIMLKSFLVTQPIATAGRSGKVPHYALKGWLNLGQELKAAHQKLEQVHGRLAACERSQNSLSEQQRAKEAPRID